MRYIHTLFLSTLLLLPLTASAQENKSRSVQVKQTSLRSSPQHWAPTLVKLKYGDQIEELGRTAGWVEAMLQDGKRGYIHSSAITERTIVIKAGNKDLKDVDQSNIVLAGKGFNQEIEGRYKENDEDLDYTAVDALEQFSIPAQSFLAFLQEGQLNIKNPGGQ